MRNTFHEQLDQLNVELIRMGALCEEAISAATKALLDGDMELGTRANALEQEIDQKEREIESQCMRLLLRQQPVARDLRAVSAALKMISDMERIGDQAADISEIALILKDRDIEKADHIAQMAAAAIRMVTDSVDAYVRQDLELARSVIHYDDVVDDLFVRIREDLIAKIAADPTCGGEALDLLMVAKYLERIGDHATNIAEWVEFSITGVHPKDEKYAR